MFSLYSLNFINSLEIFNYDLKTVTVSLDALKSETLKEF